MAVGRLSGRWIYEVLKTTYPNGVLRRALLDDFAVLLVSKRSSPGAKGRLARRLYAKLTLLQRKGQIIQEEGIIRPVETAHKPPKAEELPPLGHLLQNKLFLAMMAEDRPDEGGRKAHLHAMRWDFLARAVEEGWSIPQAAIVLGVSNAAAEQILASPPPGRGYGGRRNPPPNV
jgi:hypothetical protein